MEMETKYYKIMSNTNNCFKIVITALRGTGSGYIAVDDFTFEHSSEDAEFCKIRPDDATPTSTTASPTTTSSTEPQLPSCLFDSDACGWEIFGEDFRWYITNTSYLDDQGLLGPVGQSSGSFLYASATDGIAGENTYIMSPTFSVDASKGVCMTFTFSMFVSYLTYDKTTINLN